MADNTELDPGSGGDIIATDDISGVKYQRVKVTWGTDGVAGDVTSAYALPVTSSQLTTIDANISVMAAAVTSSGMMIVSNDLSVIAAAVTSTGFLMVSNDLSVVAAAVTNGAMTIASSDLSAIATGVSIMAAAVSTEFQVDVVGALPAGTAVIGDVGISGARTSGGTTFYKNIDVDETEDEIKGTAGQVYWISAINVSSAKLYLKFYNATAASVTVGTTTPVMTFPVPHNSANGGGFTLAIPNGIYFSTAITIAATTGVADNDTGAPGANELIVNLGYA